MRDAFIETFSAMAKEDGRLTLVTGDLGFGVLDAFARNFPNQYLNVGVAEQNMTGVAAGLALAGRRVFTYSIANFPTLRCLEQIRNDVCYHDLDVTVVAIGGGLSYGPLGFSHQATEDLAVMRALPNMRVLAPSSDREAASVTRALATSRGPAYLRLDRSAPTHLGEVQDTFELGQLRSVSDHGNDVLIVSTGASVVAADDAAEQLVAAGVGVTHVSSPTLKPFDDVGLAKQLARDFAMAVTVEEHSILGGLGGVVCESMTRPGITSRPIPVLRCGLPDVLPSVVGSQDYLRDFFGLTGPQIASAVLAHLDPANCTTERDTP